MSAIGLIMNLLLTGLIITTALGTSPNSTQANQVLQGLAATMASGIASNSAQMAKLVAAGQTIMKSCISTRRSACAPPPKIWICGKGRRCASGPPR